MIRSPKIARPIYRAGYDAALAGQPIEANPYKRRQTINTGTRWDLWRLGWKNANEGKPSQEAAIDYTWLIS